MEKISFTKMSGAGNDFIVLKDFTANSLKPVLIQKLCDRRNGIGADGVINISNAEDADFRMQYYNADGFTGTLCGNGARCALRFAYSEGITNKAIMNFISGGCRYSGEILDSGLVKFNLNTPEKIKRNFSINLNDKALNVSFADTDSPHVIILLEAITGYFGTSYSLKEVPVEALGREVRYNDAFSPGGANINFISCDEGKIYIRTYERGVEDETFACGTGSVAAAIISYLEKLVKPPVNVVTRSGENLIVDFRYEDNQFYNVSLTGPAKIIFTGEYRT